MAVGIGDFRLVADHAIASDFDLAAFFTLNDRARHRGPRSDNQLALPVLHHDSNISKVGFRADDKLGGRPPKDEVAVEQAHIGSEFKQGMVPFDLYPGVVKTGIAGPDFLRSSPPKDFRSPPPVVEANQKFPSLYIHDS